MLRKEDYSRIKAEVSIIDYASKYLKIKSSGSKKVACCPFHTEKTPSFVLYEESKGYNCFGCGANGDVIDLAMQLESVNSAYMAAKVLASMYHIPVKEVLKEEDEIVDFGTEPLIISNKIAQAAFFSFLMKSLPAKKYLHYQRGFNSESELIDWGVGYAPLDYKIDAPKADLIAAGLLSAKGYNVFRNRIMFPIHDSIGNIIGFTGRYLGDYKADGQAKYVNTRETLAYKKGRTLYGYNKAKEAIKANKEFVIVEGQTDVIALHRVDVFTAVATSGTALTDDHVRLLGKLSKKGFIMTDGDKAGMKSASRSIPLFWKENMDVSVLLLPNGHDPDSLVKEYESNYYSKLEKKTSMKFFFDFAMDEEQDEEKVIKIAVRAIAKNKMPLGREMLLKKLSFVSGYSVAALSPILAQETSFLLRSDFSK